MGCCAQLDKDWQCMLSLAETQNFKLSAPDSTRHVQLPPKNRSRSKNERRERRAKSTPPSRHSVTSASVASVGRKCVLAFFVGIFGSVFWKWRFHPLSQDTPRRRRVSRASGQIHPTLKTLWVIFLHFIVPISGATSTRHARYCPLKFSGLTDLRLSAPTSRGLQKEPATNIPERRRASRASVPPETQRAGGL